MAYTLVAKRYCNDKRCPNAGRLYHPSHSTCKMKACVDRGIAHWGHHRIAVEPRQQPPAGQEVRA